MDIYTVRGNDAEFAAISRSLLFRGEKYFFQSFLFGSPLMRSLFGGLNLKCIITTVSFTSREDLGPLFARRKFFSFIVSLFFCLLGTTYI